MAMLFRDAPADVPEGFAYHADVMTEVEERALLDGLKALAFGEVRMRGQVARRRTIHFGWTYGYETWRVEPGPPIPAFLLGARSRAARLAGVDADTMAEVLVTHYPLGLRARRRRALAVAARDPSGTRGALLGHLQDAPGWRRPGVI